MSIIVGRANDGAFIQVITQEDSYRVRYPVSVYRKEKILRLADSWFGKDHIHLSVHCKELELMGDLHYDNLTPICGNIMGPFRFLPMQCRHEVISMNHTLRGSITLNGRDFDFTEVKAISKGMPDVPSPRVIPGFNAITLPKTVLLWQQWPTFPLCLPGFGAVSA